MELPVALKPVIYKLTLNLSDLNRQVYQDFNLTIALHPSETLERMVARILAFAMNADDDLSFTKGLSTVEEPDIWLRSLDGQTLLWVELGEPAVDRIKKASRLAQLVKVYSFNSKSQVWWQQESSKFERLDAAYFRFEYEQIQAASRLVSRTMKWYVTLNDNTASIHSDQGECDVHWQALNDRASQ